MTAKNVFGIIVRVIGLLMIFGGGGNAITILFAYFDGQANLYAMSEGISGSLLLSGDFWGSLMCLAVGVYLLRGAPGLVSFAYPGVHPSRKGTGAEARTTMPEQPAA
jgi:hypothetical protein